ncbi:hypothetical protein PS2_029280 [Malus domestica]
MSLHGTVISAVCARTSLLFSVATRLM